MFIDPLGDLGRDLGRDHGGRRTRSSRIDKIRSLQISSATAGRLGYAQIIEDKDVNSLSDSRIPSQTARSNPSPHS